MAKKNQESISFDDRLVLFRYFLDIFGIKNLQEISKVLNRAEYEGYDENNNTNFYSYLKMSFKKNNLNPETIRTYDENICRYVKQINKNRDNSVKLKYFQYLSLLFTEMYLDRYFLERDKFIDDLNSFVGKINKELPEENKFDIYTDEKMNKLAYMCATGSGKTLIMHINILQFLHYQELAKGKNTYIEINKIIVLSPNEGMSNQHLEELKLSSIPAQLFSKDLTGFSASKDDVIVIDINKLKEEGKVKTVSVDSFEKNNLVLVDEGHRGLAGDVWKEYRDKISEKGFAFEYSATFKQALKSQKAKDMKSLMDEYGKAIIMDYSYKYFYEDGYGKDYRIYNLKENVTEEYRRTYLVGCLMSFFQQIKLYDTYKKEYAPFNIEKPLLVFVGNRVVAPISSSESKLNNDQEDLLTDIEQVLRFINSFVKERDKSVSTIQSLLSEETGIVCETGDLFYKDFDGIKGIYGSELSAKLVYNDIMKYVFNVTSTPSVPRLHMVHLRHADGEIALKIGKTNEYFGVISIGDASALIKRCEAIADDNLRIVVESQEFITDSLFNSINKKDSAINILVGSRKFAEGWNSWRVSTMGLINFAKKLGSQAIQLFGRGVRLKGYGGCLKRSSCLNETIGTPKGISWLETLTVFGIKAQYMVEFKNYLETEEIVKQEIIELPIHSRFSDIKKEKLKVLQIPADKNFKKQSKRMVLSIPDKGFFKYLSKHRIVLDCRSRVQTIESNSNGHEYLLPNEDIIKAEYLPYLNYNRIYDELQRYKCEKSYYNITIDKSAIKDIMRYEGWYSLTIPESHNRIDSVSKLEDLTDYAIMALKAYLDRFYIYSKGKWEAPYLTYYDLEENNENLRFVNNAYKIVCSGDDMDTARIEEIKNFIDKVDKVIKLHNMIPNYSMENDRAIITAFDLKNHLYAPLLHLKKSSLDLKVSPIDMNDGEKKFVDLLNQFLKKKPDSLNNKKVFLLRNRSKVGTGFFEADNFYPDFILWITEPGVQRISFIDPKGLLLLSKDDSKIEFSRTIKSIQNRLKETQKSDTDTIFLNSFILSITKSSDIEEKWGMRRDDMESKNIICLDREDCIDAMINTIVSEK